MRRLLLACALLGSLLGCDDAEPVVDAAVTPDAVVDGAAPDPDVGAADMDSPDVAVVDAEVDAEVDAAAPAAARVFLVGNSYVAFNRLDRLLAGLLADDPAVADPVVEAVTPGGYRLDQHAADADGTNGDTALRRALVTDGRQWDLVVLQQQSQIPGFPVDHPQFVAMIDGARTLHGLIGENGARTALMMTWGRRDGDDRNPQIFPDFPTMQALLAAGYRALADALDGPVTIAPIGLAFEAIYDDDPEGLFRDLYHPDGSHPGPLGSYLAAAVLYRVATGRPASDRGWQPDDLDPAIGAGLRAVADSIELEVR